MLTQSARLNHASNGMEPGKLPCWEEWLTAWCKCHGSFGAENTKRNLQNGNGLLWVQLIQNIQQNQRRYSQSLQSHRTYQPYQRVVKAKQGALWMLQLSSMARECGSMSSGLFLWQRHLPSRFKPDRFHQAPSQASQGRFCSTSDVLRKMLPKCCVIKCWILMDFVL